MTTVSRAGGAAARDDTPGRTSPQADGARLTHDLYLPLDGCCKTNGRDVDGTVIAGQLTLTRHIVSP